MNRRGFTLIELLVVIAIIAVLLAIAIPVLRSFQEQARVTTCMANMRQVGAVFTQYALENDRRLPTNPADRHYGPCVFRDRANNTVDLRSLLKPYLNSFQIFICPATQAAKPDDAGNTDDLLLWNYWYLGGYFDFLPQYKSKAGKLTDRGQYSYFSDIAYRHTNGASAFTGVIGSNHSRNTGGGFVYTPGNPSYSPPQLVKIQNCRGVNVLRLDGSVTFMLIGELKIINFTTNIEHFYGPQD